MQKFVLLASVASAAAFLAEEPKVEVKASEPKVEVKASEAEEPKVEETAADAAADASPKADEEALSPVQKEELEFTPKSPEHAKKLEGLKPNFKLSKLNFTCPATGDNEIKTHTFKEFQNAAKKAAKKGEKPASELDQQKQFIQACKKSCHDEPTCGGLEIKYMEDNSGTGNLKTSKHRMGWKTEVHGFIESCALVKNSNPIQYGDLLAAKKIETPKNNKDMRLKWVKEVDALITETRAALGETAKKTTRAPHWSSSFKKAESRVKNGPFGALKTEYEEFVKEGPFRCFTNKNYEDGAAIDARDLVAHTIAKLAEINVETDEKALEKLTLLKEQLEAKSADVDAQKVSEEQVQQLEAEKKKLEEKKQSLVNGKAEHEETKTKLGEAKKNHKAYKNAVKAIEDADKKIAKVDAEIAEKESELTFQQNAAEIVEKLETRIKSCAAKVEVEQPTPEVETPVKPTTEVVVAKPTPPEPTPPVVKPAPTPAPTPTPCNKKLYFLLLLLLIPIGAGAFFLFKSKKASHDDDDDDL